MCPGGSKAEINLWSKQNQIFSHACLKLQFSFSFLLLTGNIIKCDRKRKTNIHGTGQMESSLELINATLFQEQPIKCHLIQYLPGQPITSRNINQGGNIYKHPVPNYKKKSRTACPYSLKAPSSVRRSRTLIEDDTKSAELHWLRQRAALMNQNGRWRAWEERWGGHDSYHSVQLGEISWLAARTFPVECAKLCLIDSEMWRPPKTCWVLILDVQPRC